MAITVLTDAFISINGVTLSDHAKKVTTTDTRNPVDVTAFGAAATTIVKGLGDATISVDFFQDFATSKVHQTLSPLVSSTTPFTVEVRPTSAARSATNPAILMTALLMNYTGLDGQVGDASVITAEFQNASQAGITYPTS